MDIQDWRQEQTFSDDDKVNPNLLITIIMKKLETSAASSGAGPSALQSSPNDTNNNDNVKIVKKESAAKEFCKNLFNKSSVSGDKNNNQSAPVSNQYTKVTVDGLMSQLTLRQGNNQIISNNTNASSLNQNDLNSRCNSTNEQNRLTEAEERARLQRALEIQKGIEVPSNSTAECYSSSSSSPSPLIFQQQPDVSQQNRNSQQESSCVKCLHNQAQYKQFGMAHTSILPLADGEVPKFHSQDYYCHFLVPDLEKITACCYYWGKMDRYEAEKLLDGKPEGTFLLRDSAQDDYLFSVSFRKYGRSLHARIEQWNHKFSFDSHDPSVYTASTVTGLVEHYKDPASVMFFEPMLTSPLHRNYVFSLQQLCRAAIVSHTTYDGINELCLPATMKSYLKEYHYKLRIRVRQFPEAMTSLSSS